jgi:hypothetical protein
VPACSSHSCPDFRHFLLHRPQQPSPHHVDVRQRTGHLQPVQVLGQNPVSHLPELEDPLDDPEPVLDFGPNA